MTLRCEDFPRLFRDAGCTYHRACGAARCITAWTTVQERRGGVQITPRHVTAPHRTGTARPGAQRETAYAAQRDRRRGTCHCGLCCIHTMPSLRSGAAGNAGPSSPCAPTSCWPAPRSVVAGWRASSWGAGPAACTSAQFDADREHASGTDAETLCFQGCRTLLA